VEEAESNKKKISIVEEEKKLQSRVGGISFGLDAV
jgi:hypothetical protein